MIGASTRILAATRKPDHGRGVGAEAYADVVMGGTPDDLLLLSNEELGARLRHVLVAVAREAAQ